MKMLFIAFDTGFPLPAYNCQPLRGFPPGGKLLAKRGDEGQSINRQLVFNPEKRHFPNLPLLSPSGKVASVCEPIEVNLKF